VDKKTPYFNQIKLLVQILPLLNNHSCFALKGGTAINLFYRDMPRLSVDIDLVYIPIGEREPSLIDISGNLSKLGTSIKSNIKGSTVQYLKLKHTSHINKLIVTVENAVVKVEVSPVLRGTVYEPKLMKISNAVEEVFGFAQVKIVSFEDLFAGKIVAALDRQHPRDLFDIKLLFEQERVTNRLKEAFIVYLISHNRKIIEILNPSQLNLKKAYTSSFEGMSNIDVDLQDLIKTRTALIERVNSLLDNRDREFLIKFKEGIPDWTYFSVPHIKELPAVKWKIMNLNKVKRDKKRQMISKLVNIFGM
jgi:predicted nucleotidyltransferase component of viral defense system